MRAYGIKDESIVLKEFDHIDKIYPKSSYRARAVVIEANPRMCGPLYYDAFKFDILLKEFIKEVTGFVE